MSHVKYSITNWHHGNDTLRKTIQATINNFIRLVFSIKSRDSVRPTMKKHGLLSANQTYHKKIAKIFHKMKLNNLPKALTNLFYSQQETTGMTTRSKSNIYQSTPKNNKNKHLLI